MQRKPGRAELFVTCASGLDRLLLKELKELGLDAKPAHSGAFVPFSWTAIFTINYRSHLASRLLMPLSRFQCPDEETLYRETNRIDWLPYFPDQNVTLAIDANVTHDALRHSLHAAQVVKDAICDQLREANGWRPSVDRETPDIQLNLFINRNLATLSFDTSGQPLHKRGYRQATVEAPLQESLAAAVLRYAKYDGGSLCDPCCGSGTILIEAAMMTSNTPAGFFRKEWGFFRHPQFQRERWEEFRAHRDAKRTTPARLVGIDSDRKSLEACQQNIAFTGFEIDVQAKPFEKYIGPGFDWVITNPPYGRRLAESGTLSALSTFMETYAKKGYFLAGEKQIVPFASKVIVALTNGGLPCVLRTFSPDRYLAQSGPSTPRSTQTSSQGE